MVNAAPVPVNTRSEGSSRSWVRPAAYFVPSNDHLVHLVRSPSISAPFLMFIRHVVFALASYSLMKKTTVRQWECSTGRPRIPQLFLCMRTAPFADAAPGYLFSSFPIILRQQMRNRRLSHRQLSRDRGQRCLEAFQPQQVVLSVLCLLD